MPSVNLGRVQMDSIILQWERSHNTETKSQNFSGEDIPASQTLLTSFYQTILTEQVEKVLQKEKPLDL